MIPSIKSKSKYLICPLHKKEIGYLCITDKFAMKNRVLCDECIKQKNQYNDWTPLENIEELIQNIVESDKQKKISIMKLMKQIKEEILQELDLLEQKIIQIEQSVDHTNMIKKILTNSTIVISDLQDLAENLSYLTMYNQYKNTAKSKLFSTDQFQPIFNSLLVIKSNIKQLKPQLIQIEAEQNTVADYKLLFKSTPVIIPAHDYAINSVVITPDCQKIITASSEGKLKIWNIQTKSEIGQIEDNFDYAFHVIISTDGNYLASCGSSDNIIRVWNINDLKNPLYRLKYHTKLVERIAFIPESIQIISASQDHQVVLWHETKPEPSRILKQHKSSVKGLAISKNCKLMATSALDKQLIIWNIDDGFSINKQLQPHKTPCNCIEFSNDVKLMVTGSDDGSIKLWKVQNWEPTYEFTGHSTFIWTIAFSSHANLIISSSTKDIRIWNIASQQQQQQFPIHQDYYPNYCLAANHRILCTGQQNGELHIWYALN